MRSLLRWYSPGTGRWRMPTGEVWQPALAVEAVLLAYRADPRADRLAVVERSFARYRGRRSRFHDDDGWYANTWLTGYETTGDPKYLAEARALFSAMRLGWDEGCGGGVWWNTDRDYKNAITTGLFLLAAARLARADEAVGDKGPGDRGTAREWAWRAWDWYEASGLINDDGLVSDGLNRDCRNNGQRTWTYNQGVLISGLVALFRLTGERRLLTVARRVAGAAMATLVHSGTSVLWEGPDVAGNRDAHAFKGILALGLARLSDVDPDPEIARFLRANAAAVGSGAPVGVSWLGEPGPVNGATEASAALLRGAVALLDVGEPAPPGVGVRWEAEAAELVGVGTESRYGGYTGAGYVAGWRGDGQAVVFRLPTGQSTVENRRIVLRYAAGAGDAYRAVLVDGCVVADRLLLVGTGDWTRYSTVGLLVPAGSTVEVRYDSGARSRNVVNLDSLTLR